MCPGSEKIWNLEKFLDVPVPQITEQLVEVPKISSKDQILQGTREQILEVPVPRMVLPSRSSTCLSSRISLRTGFNSVLLSRTSNIPWMSPFHKLWREVEVVNTVFQERTSERICDQVGLSKCLRYQAKTEGCSVQWSRLSTSLVSRVNECNNELPSKLIIHLNFWKKWSRWKGQLHLNKSCSQPPCKWRKFSAKRTVTETRDSKRYVSWYRE